MAFTNVCLFVFVVVVVNSLFHLQHLIEYVITVCCSVWIHERKPTDGSSWVDCWIIFEKEFTELIPLGAKVKMPRKERNERKKEKKKLDAAKGCKTISSMFKSRYSSAVIYEICFITSFITETIVFVLRKSCSKKLFKIHMETLALEFLFP